VDYVALVKYPSMRERESGRKREKDGMGSNYLAKDILDS